MSIQPEEMEICLQVLQQVSEDNTLIDAYDCAQDKARSDRFKSLIAKIYKNGKKIKRDALKKNQPTKDKELQAKTLMVQTQHKLLPYAEIQDNSTSNLGQLNKPIVCYICKQLFTEIHFFYHLLCPTCAAFNYHKRNQRTDLNGRVALLTGGRIKIGYQTALKMLRDGAKVIVTTRFPRDCAKRFSVEPDLAQWQERLKIYGLDLRNLPAVEAFVLHLLETEPWLDIIINNAAQTIKRPLEFYQHLLAEENSPNRLPTQACSLIGNNANDYSFLMETKSQYQEHLPVITNAYFPPNSLDADGQQLDLRPINSWLLKLENVSTLEMLEVQLVNAVAPFIINSKLKPLLVRSPFARRFIINVSAMEGKFNRESKTACHPHTNMAKAALNMMTRTSAQDYAQANIFMNSVDTGWITDENPYPKKTHLQESSGFYTPLDVIDGMARIYDPIVQGIEAANQPLYGQFLKDYLPTSW